MVCMIALLLSYLRHIYPHTLRMSRILTPSNIAMIMSVCSGVIFCTYELGIFSSIYVLSSLIQINIARNIFITHSNFGINQYLIELFAFFHVMISPFILFHSSLV